MTFGFEQPLDFDGVLAHLLDLNGAAIDVRVESADARPPSVVNFGGLLRNAAVLDADEEATEDESWIFDIETWHGDQWAALILHRSHFVSAEFEGSLMLHIQLGPISIRISPERT